MKRKHLLVGLGLLMVGLLVPSVSSAGPICGAPCPEFNTDPYVNGDISALDKPAGSISQSWFSDSPSCVYPMTGFCAVGVQGTSTVYVNHDSSKVDLGGYIVHFCLNYGSCYFQPGITPVRGQTINPPLPTGAGRTGRTCVIVANVPVCA